jgi:hypothetical protein
MLSVRRLAQPRQAFGSKHLDERCRVVRDAAYIDRCEPERSKLGQSIGEPQGIRCNDNRLLHVIRRHIPGCRDEIFGVAELPIAVAAKAIESPLFICLAKRFAFRRCRRPGSAAAIRRKLR